MSTLEGRTTIQSPKVVVDDFIEIQRELIENNQEFILCIDIMLINQQALFTIIGKDIRFRGLFPLDNRIKEECYRYLDVVMRHYNKADFSVESIDCDGEFK